MRKKLLAVLMGTLLLALSVCGCGGEERDSESGRKDDSGKKRGSELTQNDEEELSVPLTPETLFDVTDTEGGVSIVYNDIEGGDINIPAQIGGKTVTEIGGSAFWCTMITSVIIPEEVTKIDKAAFNLTWLEKVVVPEKVTEIGEWAFMRCTRLTSVSILGNVKQIKERTFYGCSVLTDVTLPYSVTEIGDSAFAECRSLKNLTLPDNVISVDRNAFSGCKDITVTYRGTEYSYDELEDLYAALDEAASVAPSLPAEDFFNVEEVEGGVSIFYAESSVGLYFYNGEEGIVRVPEQIGGKTVVEIGSSVFVGSRYIVDLTIPDTVVRIGGSAFNGCEELVHITLPSGLTELEGSLFMYCKKLQAISIPSGVTKIGNSAFFGCDSLSTIFVPEGVTEIGYFAFQECKNLSLVSLPDSLVSLKDEVFVGSENVTVTYKGAAYKYEELDALYSAIKGE